MVVSPLRVLMNNTTKNSSYQPHLARYCLAAFVVEDLVKMRPAIAEQLRQNKKNKKVRACLKT